MYGGEGQQLALAQQVIDWHVTSSVDGRCVGCGVPGRRLPGPAFHKGFSGLGNRGSAVAAAGPQHHGDGGEGSVTISSPYSGDPFPVLGGEHAAGYRRLLVVTLIRGPAEPVQLGLPYQRRAVRGMARTVCPKCGGSGQDWEQKKEWVACGRCGGSGTKRTGKVTVPCSGCGGAGGKTQTTNIIGKCRSCGGRGSW